MVHGNPTWSFYYRKLVERFQASHRCVVPDHIGCGRSDKPQVYDYSLKKHIDNLETLVLALKLESIVLIVHDWGGAIGMGLATRLSEKIKGFVVMNSAAFLSDRIPLRISICRWPWVGSWLVRGLNGFCRAAVWMAMARRRPLRGSARAGLLAPYDSWEHRVGVHRFVMDIPVEAGHPTRETVAHIENQLSRFRDRPMLLLWGAKDFCFDLSFYRRWCREFPEADQQCLKDVGHYVLEDADEAVDIIATFIDKHFH